MGVRFFLLFMLLSCAGDKPGDSAEPCTLSTYYADGDGDGYGDPSTATEACEAPEGMVTDGTDCDDAVFTDPGAAEVWYDGVDQDCAGDSDFDQDGDGEDALAYGGADCDDLDPSVSSTAAEVWYDGVDQDCAGDSDFDQDGDGEDAADGGGADCDDLDPSVSSTAAEVWYDGIDQDCSGGSDFDQDGDGEDATAGGGADCDDGDAAVSSQEDEVVCNGRDDDCNGLVDDLGITIQSGLGWVVSSTVTDGWSEIGYDDSAWVTPSAPAPNDCGWVYTPENLGRPYEAWEHSGTPTMWSSDGATHIYLRFSFTLPPGADITMAMLTSIVDDEHTVYLNGAEINRDTEPYGVPIVTTDLSPYLMEGENVLAIDAEDLGGCAWMLADATVTCEQ